jgi:deoxyribodipyrimidine photolyase-related protein
MVNEAAIIFPHQLFEHHPSVVKGREVWYIEDDRFFTDFRFHKKKLLLHRASMRFSYDRLRKQGYRTNYVELGQGNAFGKLISMLREKRIKTVRLVDPADHVLEERINTALGEAKIAIIIEPSPNFLTPVEFIHQVFDGARHYSMAHFYMEQRKRMGILVKDGKPVGGRWSFDQENRRKIPEGIAVPPIHPAPRNVYVREAATYVNNQWPDNPGSTEGFIYPVTPKDARRWLRQFLVERLDLFGDYEDGMRETENFLFHSVLTPSLNIGLLTPSEVVEEMLRVAAERSIHLNSLEGFLRQVTGWREFMRAIYLLAGEKQRRSNFWAHKRSLPSSLYAGRTGIGPVDTVIGRLVEHGYAHHIERLMVLGNFMLLCEIDPHDIHRWFMELFIDAYDWVMVPNVYGMSQYADGGLITTKPYLSGSHYLRKMSDFRTGDWCEIWDSLFWRFIGRHRNFFAENPRLSVMVRQFDHMDRNRARKLLHRAEEFLAQFR